MKINHNGSRIDTTVGDLIAAVSEVAFEYSADAKEAYHLTVWCCGRYCRAHAPGVISVTRRFSGTDKF